MALLLLILIERIFFLLYEGIDVYGGSDDKGYVEAGILFAKTGIISIWGDLPSAMAMPFTVFIIGIISKVFGEGMLFLGVCKALWILMAMCSAFVTYKTVRLFLPRWCADLSVATFLLPNFAWSDKI